MTLRDKHDVTCVLAASKEHGAQETDPPALASLASRRLTWTVHVTAIITPCLLPLVVGEVTSSVTVTALPEVYGLPKAGRNGARYPVQNARLSGAR